MKNDGLDETLKALKKDNLQTILENGLGVDVHENTAKAMAEQLASEVRSIGVEVMLSKLKVPILTCTVLLLSFSYNLFRQQRWRAFVRTLKLVLKVRHPALNLYLL